MKLPKITNRSLFKVLEQLINQLFQKRIFHTLSEFNVELIPQSQPTFARHMKSYLKSGITLAFCCSLFITSCIKQKGNPSEDPAPVSKFSNLKTSAGFDWATTKALEINITGLNTLAPVAGTLVISDLSGTKVYYQGKHLMNESIKLKLILPSVEKNIQLKFGSVIKSYTLAGSVLNADYVINVPETE